MGDAIAGRLPAEGSVARERLGVASLGHDAGLTGLHLGHDAGHRIGRRDQGREPIGDRRDDRDALRDERQERDVRVVEDVGQGLREGRRERSDHLRILEHRVAGRGQERLADGGLGLCLLGGEELDELPGRALVLRRGVHPRSERLHEVAVVGIDGLAGQFPERGVC